jgi:uncharacterized repeat protein (TIGR03803 family)
MRVLKRILFLSLFLCQCVEQPGNAQVNVLHPFILENDLSRPSYSNDLVTDGTWFYGMTPYGGSSDLGTLFKIKADGTGYTKLVDFGDVSKGSRPIGSLLLVGSVLYGATTYGGVSNLGVIFKLNTDGTGFTKLMDFDGPATGSYPRGALSLSGSGLFGMTYKGGNNNLGVIYKINTDGTGFSKLLDFDGSTLGAYPINSLTLSGSVMYGMTWRGGTNDIGVIFKINQDGTGYTRLLDFDGVSTGAYPNGALLLSGSVLYGMTYNGGTNNLGVLFRINTDGTGFNRLLDFDGSNHGSGPVGSLTISGSVLYGLTMEGGSDGLGTLFKINSDGSGYNKFHEFDGTATGASPYGSLTLSGSVLYGMTNKGGRSDHGVIFKINTDGNSFGVLLDMWTGINGGGCSVNANMVTDGTWIYGTTIYGGINDCGTLFKVKTDGSSYTRLFDFEQSVSGKGPSGAIVLSASVLYGIAGEGGTNNEGVIYRINTDGTGFIKLHDFSGTTSGSSPNGLILSGSTLYGMTYSGGTSNYGVVFKINTSGSGFTKLLDFDGANGAFPAGDLLVSGSTLYGLTSSGGTSDKGVIFKINTDGTGFSKMLDFDGSSGQSGKPYGSLILSGLSLYGTTFGFTNNFGIIFKINTDGTGFTKLVDFDGASNGRNSYSTLLMAGNYLLGTTSYGGLNDRGTLFSVKNDGSDFSKLADFSSSTGVVPQGYLLLEKGITYGITGSGGQGGGSIFSYSLHSKFDGGPADQTACQGSNTGFGVHASAAGISYQWQENKNGNMDWINISSSGTNPSYAQWNSDSLLVGSAQNLSDGNLYRCILTNRFAVTDTSDAAALTVFPVPSGAGAIVGPDTVCQGTGGHLFSVPVIAGATGYLWNLPAGFSGSSAGNSITIEALDNATTGSISVSGRNAYCSGTESNAGIVIPATITAGSISGLNKLCKGTSDLTYTVPPSAGAVSYTWDLPEGFTGISTINSIEVDAGSSAVSGVLVVNAVNQCGIIGPGSQYAITVNRPVSPKIKVKWHDVLTCINLGDSIVSYQWYKDGTAIPGETQQYLVTHKQAGEYMVEVTDKNACQAFSGPVNGDQLKSMSLSPNPAPDRTEISIMGAETGAVSIKAYNSQGILVQLFYDTKSEYSFRKNLEISLLPEGEYILVVELNNQVSGSVKLLKGK